MITLYVNIVVNSTCNSKTLYRNKTVYRIIYDLFHILVYISSYII